MTRQQIPCTTCGAPVDWDGSYSHPVECSYCGARFVPSVSGTDDVWLMTDPVARARYEFEGRLDALAHDIRFEVMRAQDWSLLDRAFVAEAARLEQAGVIRRLASYWAVSPHPPIFRAVRSGSFSFGERAVPFNAGQELVWACPMTRDRFNLTLPVLVGDFQSARVGRLCGEMTNAMMGRMAR